MKKRLKKRNERREKTFQLFSSGVSCSATCTGCASSPSYDYQNVLQAHREHVRANATIR